VCEPVRRFKFNRNIDPQKAITEGQLAGKRDEFYDLQWGREGAHCSSDTKGRSRDVIALQEVESLFSLKKFRSQYLRNTDYKYIFVVDGNHRRSIDAGILSRYPIEKIEVRVSMYCYD
jgi:hypothetical protein